MVGSNTPPTNSVRGDVHLEWSQSNKRPFVVPVEGWK